ncbi:AAA family ATPase [Streptomyces sp. NPDC057743]|uniref:helix-turn-helix transcriptional regulator n=1 Tax=Streptomyces sp. NPDC057743 TaxID=3346236 RepID=UPI0036833425
MQPAEIFSTSGRDTVLVGRERERERLAELVRDACAGRSGALVVRGAGGCGRSALLDDLARGVPSGVRVLRTTGVESEAELPWAGLHQVLRPLLPGLERIPEPQAAALRAAFGLGGDRADPFLLSLAGLALLSDACVQGPVALLVDDAQWLDPASADVLVFVARRLAAEGLAMVFAARDGSRSFEAPDLPELVVGPLSAGAAERLLGRVAPEAVRAVRQRILRVAGGNPLALHGLPAALNSAQLRGSSPLPDHLPLDERLRRVHGERAGGLSEPHGRVLLLAALQDDGDLTVILGACEDRDAATSALCAAASAGLIEWDEQRVRFRDPLVRSALYQAAPLAERHAAHRALARTLDEGDERRVWHLAASTMGQDDAVAELLAGYGDRARRAGRIGTAGRAMRRAAGFASSPRARATWLLDAAACAWETAEPAHARALLDEAEGLSTEPAVRARAVQLRGTMAVAEGEPAGACRALLEGARLALDGDAGRAAELLVVAARSAWAANRPRELAEVAALLERIDPGERRVPAGFLAQLRYLAGLSCDAAPRAALPERAGEDAGGAVPPWYGGDGFGPWRWWPPAFLPCVTGESGPAVDALQRAVRALRTCGATGALPLIAAPLVSLQLLTGQWTAAAELAREALAEAEESGQWAAAAELRAALAWAAAVRGEGELCRELADEALSVAIPRELAAALSLAYWALGLTELVEGRAAGAARLLREVTTPGAPAEHFAVGHLVLPDLVEAYARAGEAEAARAALEQFERCAAPAGVPALRAAWQRCRALLADHEEADAAFTAALDADAASPFEAGRGHLLYGEWLRRARRIKAARDHLHQALHLFQVVGAAPWAAMARAELRAAGEQVGRLDRGYGDLRATLTPREMEIVHLAAEGKTNSDIAAQLYLSPRTVGHHLYKVFPKLGITSRHQLRAMRLEMPTTAPSGRV